jgi:multidrug efflux pump
MSWIVDQPVRGQAEAVAGAGRRSHRSADRRVDGILAIDRVSASRLGIAPSTVDNTLYDAFGQRQINTMYTQLNQYHVIMEAQPNFANDPQKLNKIYIQGNASRGATGAAASTSFSASASATAGTNASHRRPPSILPPPACLHRPPTPSLPARTHRVEFGQHQYQFHPQQRRSPGRLRPYGTRHRIAVHQPPGSVPSVTVSFNLAPNASLGEAIDAINKAAKDLNFPASVQTGFQGTAAAFENSLSNEALLILAALVTVYIVLGVLYESFVHPITILSTLPSAGVGALLSLILFPPESERGGDHRHHPADRHREKERHHDGRLRPGRENGSAAWNSTEAIYEASLLRFRPIMMTTMAALAGRHPAGRGNGHRLRAPPSLGIAMVGGLLLSQVLTLYTTPVIYIFFDNLSQRFSPSRRRAGGPEPQPAGEA